MMSLGLRGLTGLIFGAAIGMSFGDTIITAHVDVNGTYNPRTEGIPVPGDYKFVFGKDQAVVTSPAGKTFVLDFSKRSFTSINPTTRSFYESEISDVLGIGNRAPAGGKVDGSVDFSQDEGAVTPSSLAQPTKAYRVSLKTSLALQGGSPGGIGGGYTPRGGFVFSGANATQKTSVSLWRHLDGQFWMGDPVMGLDRDQMNTAVECVLLWSAPEMKELANRVKKSNLAIYGTQYSLVVEGQSNDVITKPPTVSIKLISVVAGTLDPALATVPQGFKRTNPPAGPFGT